MLQTLVEAGSWLLRLSEDYRHSMIVLREAKNVKYGTFMEPGNQLAIEVELIGQEGTTATFKGKGETGGASTVSARFTLDRYNLRDRNPALESADRRLVEHLRERAILLMGPSPAAPASHG
jgi:3-hydroxyacyl-[acyl-carrier-protein] dehydratase